jgi:hypothetical protein
MKFGRIGLPGAEGPALFHAGKNYSLADLTTDIGVVMGRRAPYLGSPTEAREHLAGFVNVSQ